MFECFGFQLKNDKHVSNTIISFMDLLYFILSASVRNFIQHKMYSECYLYNFYNYE